MSMWAKSDFVFDRRVVLHLVIVSDSSTTEVVVMGIWT